MRLSSRALLAAFLLSDSVAYADESETLTARPGWPLFVCSIQQPPHGVLIWHACLQVEQIKDVVTDGEVVPMAELLKALDHWRKAPLLPPLDLDVGTYICMKAARAECIQSDHFVYDAGKARNVVPLTLEETLDIIERRSN